MWGLLPVHTELHLSGILPAAICSPEFLKYQRKKIFDKKRTSLTDQWSFPWFLLGLVFDTLFTTECAEILSRGGAASASAASRGNGSCCVWCNCPKNLCECKEGLHWIFFPPFPLFLLKTQLELYNFDISITILSFNSYNRPQLPVDLFASASAVAACSGPHSDPERAQAVLLTRALLMITNLAISSLPSAPFETKPLIWICSTLTHPSCQSLPSFLLLQMCRKQASEQKKTPSSIKLVSCGLCEWILLFFSCRS